jgi:ABC-type transporter Mla subunit MlaD
MYARHAEIRVGLLVIGASLALLGLLFYATGGGFWGEWRYVTLRFRPGNLAPREGDPIQVNGVKVGTVDRVDLKTEIREGDRLTAEDKARISALRRRDPTVPEAVREVYVEVIAKLGCDIRCPVGTRGEIGESVTQTRYLILIPGSSPLDLSDEDTQRHPIPVTEKPGLSSLAAQVEALTVKAGDAVVTADEALGEIRDLVAQVRAQVAAGKVEEIFNNIRETTAGLKRTIAALEQDLAAITGDVKVGTEDFRQITASVSRLAGRLEQEIPAAVADVRGLVAKVGGVVDRAAPKVDEFLDDVNRTGKNLVALSSEFGGIGDDARAVVKDLGGDLDTLADTLIDTGRNLLDASEDLRAHPWKLLNEPSEDEIAYENLRNTMQNYVRAMQHMNATARTLQAILQRGDAQDPTVRALLERTLLDFNKSEERYRSAEKQLVELLQQGDGKAPRPNAPRPR